MNSFYTKKNNQTYQNKKETKDVSSWKVSINKKLFLLIFSILVPFLVNLVFWILGTWFFLNLIIIFWILTCFFVAKYSSSIFWFIFELFIIFLIFIPFFS